jgi:uncharacterized protein (DUF1800 family)
MSTVDVDLDRPREGAETTQAPARGQGPVVSRRRVLGVLGGAIGLAACSDGLPKLPPDMVGGGDPPSGVAPLPPASSGPIPTVLEEDAELHLARRASFGLTPELVDDVRTKGASAWLAEQLAPETIADGDLDGLLSQTPILNESAQRVRQIGADDDRQGGYKADQNFVKATMLRAIYSKRHLFEVVVGFWTNHFNVVVPNDDDSGRKMVEDREVIREHALGRFADLLKADAKSPAMMRYLNQDASRADGENVPNENYAREVMELHCLGAGVLYSEADIKELARLFTGMTRDEDTRTYVFRPQWHDDNGPIRVLGFETPNDDTVDIEEEIDRFLEYLAGLPETARFLSFKLARRFVADDPPEGLVDSLEQVFLDNDGQIVPWLEALFTSPEFAGAVGQKLKTPDEDFYSSVRVLGHGFKQKPNDPYQLRYVLERLGRVPCGWPTPDGYPETRDKYFSAGEVLERFNMHWAVSHGYYNDHLDDADQVMAALVPEVGVGATVGDLVDALAQRVIFQDAPADDRAAIVAYTQKADTDTIDDEGTLRYLTRDITALLLDSRAHVQK